MPPRRQYDWEAIRAEYEAGATMGELSRKHGVSKPAISKRAKTEGWIQDASEAVARLADAKVNGLVNTVNPKKRAEAVDQAADRRAAVINRHREEWVRHQAIIDKAIAENDFERAKLAKITAETLKIRQEGERKAWGIQDKTEVEQRIESKQAVAVNIDFASMTPEQISEIGIALMQTGK